MAVQFRAIDWRRWLIYVHRWLGIAGCLVFLMWFASGIVMMYERMPRLTPEERLARLEALDSSRIRVPVAEAAATAGVRPSRVRVGMSGGRPVYRLEADGEWSTIFADTGERLTSIAAAQSLDIVRRLIPEAGSTLRPAGRITQPDQWTLDGGLPRFLPMQRVALGDEAGTVVYVSERTGEPVMKTTHRGRIWGYAGAVLHWTYFTPFRMERELWRYSIIVVALVGCVMCLTGLIVGIWRFSPGKFYRLKRVPSHSPYSGWMWWHHYAGLLFGLFTFTWALSGALSLTPWDWAPSTDPGAAQQLAVSGGPLRLERITPAVLRDVAQTIDQRFPVKELEILQFDGRAFAMAYRPDDLATASRSRNRDVSAIMSPQLQHAHLNAWLDQPSRVFDRLPDDAVVAAGRKAMPESPVQDATWLLTYDDYYYDRTGAKPLPVLRVSYADDDRTAMYFDPQTGLIAMRQTTLSRANRWLYNGLHSFDFASIYYRRPLWDVVVLALSVGGVALTITTLMPAFRRLRRHARRVIPGERFRNSSDAVTHRHP
jgi:hypothetical protein